MKFVESIKAFPGRTKAGIDNFLANKLHFSDKQIELLWHYLSGLWVQVLAIIPISVLQIAVLGIFYSQVRSPWTSRGRKRTLTPVHLAHPCRPSWTQGYRLWGCSWPSSG